MCKFCVADDRGLPASFARGSGTRWSLPVVGSPAAVDAAVNPGPKFKNWPGYRPLGIGKPEGMVPFSLAIASVVPLAATEYVTRQPLQGA